MIMHTLRLDVRPILASGRDPFAEIMQAARDVPVNGAMVVVAPFDPVPLRDVLGASGFTSTAVPRGPQEWEITFCRTGTAGPGDEQAQSSLQPAIDEADPAQARAWTEHGEFHVDTRGLATEAALQGVLEALDALDRGSTLVAHLDRNIDALYPELSRRDCEAAFVPGEGAEVRLEISTPT